MSTHPLFKIILELGKLRVVSWNARTHFASRFVDFRVTKSKWDMVERLMNGYDVILIQEAHGSHEAVRNLGTKYPSWEWFGSFGDSEAAGGLLFGISKKVVKQVGRARFKEVVGGRIAALSLGHGTSSLNIFNVHIEPQDKGNISVVEFRKMLADIKTSIDSLSGSSFLLGDWNFVDSEEGRLNLTSGQVEHQETWREREFNKVLHPLAELVQPDYTRRKVQESNGTKIPVQLARIDRSFTNLNTIDVLDMNITAGVIGKATVYSPLSDHIPHYISISAPSLTPMASSKIPQWIAAHPLFQSILARYTKELDKTCCLAECVTSNARDDADNNICSCDACNRLVDWSCGCRDSNGTGHCDEPSCKFGDPFERIELYKQCAHSSLKQFKTALSKQVAITDSEKLYWSSRYYRIARSNHNAETREIRKCTAAFGKLNECIVNGKINLDKASDVIQQLQTKITNALIDELDKVDDDETGSDAKLAKFRKLENRSRRWAISKRRIQLSGIRDQDGTCYDDVENASRNLYAKWNEIAVERKGSEKLRKLLRHYIQVAPSDTKWTINRESFWDSVLVKFAKKKSAPGPDGVPYLIWLFEGEFGVGAQILFDSYIEIVKGRMVPLKMLEALMVFLIKDPYEDKFGGEDDSGVRMADELRPSCLGNADAKLLTAAAVPPLNYCAEFGCHQDQNGMIKGRSMFNSILELEAGGLRCSALNGHDPALFLTDFWAAFPTLFHDWIFFVLSKMGIPKWLFDFLKFLYDNATADLLVFGVKTAWRIKFSRGVRQGGTESGVLFVLAIDPLVKWISMRAYDLHDTVKFYADDWHGPSVTQK